MSRKLNHATLRRGFTLVELLVVVGIIVMVAGFLVPAVGPLFRGSQMTVASEQVAGVLNSARQSALARDATVEVRFCSFLDPSNPADSNAPHFHVVQAFDFNTITKAYTPLDKATILTNPLILDQGQALSPLFSFASTTGSDPNLPPLPRAGTNYTYRRFIFYRDGSTSLPIGSQAFFTIHSQTVSGTLGGTSGDSLAQPPPDYATIQVDPYNGAVKMYRP